MSCALVVRGFHGRFDQGREPRTARELQGNRARRRDHIGGDAVGYGRLKPLLGFGEISPFRCGADDGRVGDHLGQHSYRNRSVSVDVDGQGWLESLPKGVLTPRQARLAAA